MESFINRRPVRSECLRCGEIVLSGIAMGLSYRVDPIPLTMEGEIVARLGDRSTWSYLFGQMKHRIEHDVRKTPRSMVVATHKCGSSLIEYFDMTRIHQLNILMIQASRSNEEVDDMVQRATSIIWDALHGKVIDIPDDTVNLPLF